MTENKNQAINTKERIHTRERILGAAESLFMERGYTATSLRVITAKAQVNLAAVNYHFGSKEALIREVFERRLGPLNAARITHLDQLEAAARGRPLAIEQIIEAIIAPPLHVSAEPLARGTAVFLRLFGRAFSEPADTLREILPAQYRQVVIRFKQALARSLPDMPDQELTWRMHFMFGTLSYTMAGNDALNIATCNLENADDAQAIMRRLIPFLAAGLQAPLPASQSKPGLPGRRAA